MSSARVCAYSGSSPRVRGTPLFLEGGAQCPRFIPARAGNSSTRTSGKSLGAVHPRACGELRHLALLGEVRCGSSPRVRGTPTSDRGHERIIRFIPARAGNSTVKRCHLLGLPVHPRACGELFGQHSTVYGSSPRVRGTLRIAGGSTGQVGSSPRVRRARECGSPRAGNSATKSRARGATTVHPRACGELSSRRRITDPSTGSSPRVRGTPQA